MATVKTYEDEVLKSSYWNNNGKFQNEYDTLFSTLVPSQGKCETVEGELLRAVGRIYYDYYNNGNLNNTSGANIFLQKFLPNKSEQIISDLKAHYSESNQGCYTTANLEAQLERITDAVIEHVLSVKDYTPNNHDMFDFQEDDFFEEDTYDYDDAEENYFFD